jgi:chromate reductase
VQILADQIAVADAVIVVGPEYNKALSGVLKNALDWVSRTQGNPWRDKPVAILSATAGRSGGERTQNSMRLCMMPFRARVLPGPEVLIGGASKEFDEDGRLTNERNIAAGGADGRPAQGRRALGQARLGAKLRRDAVDAVTVRDRP